MTIEKQATLMEQVLRLPRCSEMSVPTDYMDANGHMNMMYYTLVGNIGSRHFWQELGLSGQLKRTEGKRSTFMLRQVLNYVHELREGENIAIYTGLYNFDAKKLHYFVYTVSLDQNWVSCVDERLEISINMTIRRSAPFEPEVMERIQQVRAAHAATGWQPEPSGAIKLKE